jgi:hypothetical protein
VNRWRGLVRFTTKALYYGWYIVVACNFVALMTWGIGIFNQGVFLGFFEREYGWSRSMLSIGPMLFHLLNPGDEQAQRGSVQLAFLKFQ